MLKILRDNATSFIVKILLGIIVLVFVFLGVGSNNSGRNNTVAKVNGEEISTEDYKASYDRLMAQYRQYFQNNLTDELVKSLNLKGQALDRLIDRVVVRQQAENMKLVVSDGELSAAIARIPSFQKDGMFNIDLYKQILASNRQTPESFEISLRADLLSSKIQQIIADDVKVSDLEAKEWFNWENSSYDVAFLKYDPASFKGIDPTDEEIKIYFEKNGDSYKTKPKMKIKYVTFDPTSFKLDVQVADEDIKIYYEDRLDDFTHEKQVEASHILIRVKDGDDTKALADAEKVYALAAAGGDFAKLAAKYSEGPTKSSGGFLGSFKQKDMVKPFADQAFSMKAGDVSKPVKTQFGYHVIKVSKVEESNVDSLADVSAKIKGVLEQEKRSIAAYDQAMAVYDTIVDGEKIDEATGVADVTVGETDLFAMGDAIAGFKNPGSFSQEAFKLSGNEISDVLEIDGKYLLIQASDRVESKVDDLSNVKEKVRLDLITKLQNDKASQSAEAALKLIADGKTLEEAGKALSVTPDTTGLFKKTDTVEKLENHTALKNAAVALSAEKPLIEKAIKGYNGYYVIKFKEKQLPTDKDYEDKKAEVVKNLESRKQNDAIRDWVAQSRENSEIVVDKEIIKRF